MDKATLIERIRSACASDGGVELVIVADTRGSSPRSAGAWMAVFADGSSAGTVGGGAVERLAIGEAARLLERRASRLASVGMDGTTSDSGMVCGGAVTLAYLYVGHAEAAALARAAKAMTAREDAVLAIDLAALEGTTEVVDAAVSITVEPFDGGELRAPGLREGRYEEPLCPEGYVYLFGCGHVGQATARALVAAGFSVIACDDRPAMLTPELLPGVAERRLVDYRNLAATCAVTSRDMVVTATSGHRFDLTVLKQVLASHPSYVGCLASKKKAAYVREELAGDGYAAEDISAIHMPIGLPISAETPEEIAVSIVAEMVLHRRTKLMPGLRS